MSNYDKFFIEDDKPYAENLNDCVLLSNALGFSVVVDAPSQFSNGVFVDGTTVRKCGVSTIKLDTSLSGVTVTDSGASLTFTSGSVVTFCVYPNFNMFKSWDKVSWTTTGTGSLSVDLLKSDGTSIVSGIGNGTSIGTYSELSKLATIKVRLTASGDVKLTGLKFYFTKDNSSVSDSNVLITGYSTTTDMNTAITNATVNKADITSLNTHTSDSTSHITSSERSNWNSKAEGTHIHSINDVTTLQSSLGAKAPLTHTTNSTVHITSSERSNWNSKANGSHTHTLADVTDLQSSLDSKSYVGHTHNEWVDKSNQLGDMLELGVTHHFYVNEALRLANYVLSHTKSSQTSGGIDLFGIGIIPDYYRPLAPATTMSRYNYGLISICSYYEEEDYFVDVVYSPRKTISSTFTIDVNLLWRY